ncbi:hypothetical protein [Streptomyces palmae]|uniref:AG1 protein n=1 Tax=Streptomyces palmae TaxID=1701085 RepID=A0A4Z0G8Q9_9ACTN|nr:hypothetical protein [Streptomyces palmae]TGA92612.1 hypothetical protein E4099_27450 [Streptomyces palmae]
MSFEDEWREALRQSSATAGTRLDHVAEGGKADLVVKRDDLGAIGHDAYRLHTAMTKNGRHAHSSTAAAATALTNRNFTCGAALTKVNRDWSTQLDTLKHACAQISNHLDYTQAAHAKDDQHIAGELTAVSKILKYWK